MKRLVLFLPILLTLLPHMVQTCHAASAVTLGSTQTEVEKIHGAPSEKIITQKNHEVWRYGYSTITFNANNKKIIKWKNTGNLKINLAPRDKANESPYFSRGSHKDTVLHLQGTPTEIQFKTNAATSTVWRYGRSTISFAYDRVTNWSNAGNLKVSLGSGKVSPKSSFTIGSPKDRVLKIHGTPSAVASHPDFPELEVWRYGYDTITISKTTHRVIGYESAGKLKIHISPGDNISKDASFHIGSHKDDVLRLQGTPSGVRQFEALGYELWRYGYSVVKISKFNHKVNSYTNRGNLLAAKDGSAQGLKKITYHSKADNITLYYDSDRTFAGLFRIKDKQLGNIYGIIKKNIIFFYNRDLQFTDLFAYLTSDTHLAAKSHSGEHPEEWLNNFASRLNAIYETSGDTLSSGFRGSIHSLILNSRDAVYGISTEHGPLSVDTLTLPQETIRGGRVKIGNIVLGNWWTEDGSHYKGISHDLGKLKVYQFTLPDGTVTSGSTLSILPSNK